jgi:hypothetical protein
MRKQIVALLSALGLVGSAALAAAQQPAGGKSDPRIKAESTLKKAKALQETMAVRRGQDAKYSKAKADGTSNTLKTSTAHKLAQASGKRQEGSSGGNTSSARRLTLNPQPLPPGVHTLNPQPLPPGVHTLNPQPLPPGVHGVSPVPTPSGIHPLNPQTLLPAVQSSTGRRPPQGPQSSPPSGKPAAKKVSRPPK